MTLDSQDTEFISGKLPAVEGWLLDDAAYLTTALMREQAALGIGGSVFEIGVFAGKYLSLLFHLSQTSRDHIVGFDIFEWYPREKVIATFSTLFGDLDRLALLKMDSTQAAAGDLMAAIGCKARFISVDGAHTAPAVAHDLELAESLVASGGIVAIDDFLNPRAVGVSEGAYRYFIAREGAGLVPFAYCANKLFAAPAKEAGEWNARVWTFAQANPGLSMSIEFQKLAGQGRHWVEQNLAGQRVLIF